MGIELDKDMAATLTEEELAAINDSEMSEEELAALKGIAEDGDDGEDEDDDDDEDAGAQDKSADDAQADDEDAGQVDSQVDDAGDEESAAEFKPQFRSQLPEDFDAQVSAVNDEMRALAQQFKDGDVDFDEYNAKLQDLNARRDELSQAKITAQVFEQMNAQQAQQEWQWTVKQFMSKVAREEKIDYQADAEKGADLDLFVRRLAENPANNNKPMDWFLQEAHKRVKALHGLDAGAPAAKPSLDDVKKSRKPPVGAAPKTLAQVPGSDGPGDISSEFADLDGLDGMDLENAIAKMTPAQRERYAKAA